MSTSHTLVMPSTHLISALVSTKEEAALAKEVTQTFTTTCDEESDQFVNILGSVGKRQESPSATSASTASSPVFDSSSVDDDKDGQSSAGSLTSEDEIDNPDLIRKEEDRMVSQTSKLNNEESSMGMTIHRLKPKRSLWNMIRGSTPIDATVACMPVLQQEVSVPTTTTEETILEKNLSKVKSTESPATLSNRRGSFSPFPNLNINWGKAASNRRHTMTAMVVDATTSSIPNSTLSVDRSLDGSAHLPRNFDEAQIAKDAIRFADAKHIIKTQQDIEIVRDLAQRLESGWIEKQFELAEIRAKMGEMQLHLIDLRDENKQLRSQLGNMSEQIITRDADLEALQKVIVDQSKREKEVWELEKRQEVEAIENRFKESLRNLKEQRYAYDTDDDDDDDDDSDDEEGRNIVLFSANTSIDDSGGFFTRQDGDAAAPLATLRLSSVDKSQVCQGRQTEVENVQVVTKSTTVL